MDTWVTTGFVFDSISSNKRHVERYKCEQGREAKLVRDACH